MDASIANVNPPKSAAASGLLHGFLDGEAEDGDDDDDDEELATTIRPDEQAQHRA